MRFLKSKIWERVAQFGAYETGVQSILLLVNRFIRLQKIRCLILNSEDINQQSIPLAESFSAGFVSQEQLQRHIGSHSNSYQLEQMELTQDFVSNAFSKGDRCFGIFFGGKLVSYGWYARSSTPFSEDLNFEFSPRYTYMYKGYTHPDFRGQRLHATGIVRALLALESEGLRGMVSYVDRTNLSSLKSVYRMGFKNIGDIYILSIGSRNFIRGSRTLKSYDMRVVSPAQGKDDPSNLQAPLA